MLLAILNKNNYFKCKGFNNGNINFLSSFVYKNSELKHAIASLPVKIRKL